MVGMALRNWLTAADRLMASIRSDQILCGAATFVVHAIELPCSFHFPSATACMSPCQRTSTYLEARHSSTHMEMEVCAVQANATSSSISCIAQSHECGHGRRQLAGFPAGRLAILATAY